jgi:hypothetical protein
MCEVKLPPFPSEKILLLIATNFRGNYRNARPYFPCIEIIKKARQCRAFALYLVVRYSNILQPTHGIISIIATIACSKRFGN